MFEEIKQKFREGNFVWIIITICTGVFVLNTLLNLLARLFQQEASTGYLFKLAMPLYFSQSLSAPWTIVTNIFVHIGIGHLFFNMLTLYWFGQIYQLYMGNKYAWKVFMGGAIFGCILVLISYNLFSFFPSQNSVLAGASGGILAIIFAATTLNPEHEIYLFFIGSVRLKYVALMMILLNWVAILGENSGGVIAHLGGAFFGWFYMKQIQRGRDFLHFSFRRKMRVSYSNPDYVPTEKKDNKEQEKLDAILDKIKTSGYDSLSKNEKDFLFRYSQKQD